MMVFLIWSISSSTLDSEDRVSKRDDVFQMARLTLRKLTDDISMAFLVSNQDLLGKTKDGANIVTGFIGDEKGGYGAIDLATFSHWRLFRNAKESEQCEVGYYVEKDPDIEDEDVYRLMRRESVVIDNEVSEGGKTYPLALGLKDFKLEYYDGRQNEWKKEWNSTTAENKDKLPRAVKIELSFPDPSDDEFTIDFSTIAFIALWQYPIEF